MSSPYLKTPVTEATVTVVNHRLSMRCEWVCAIVILTIRNFINVRFDVFLVWRMTQELMQFRDQCVQLTGSEKHTKQIHDYRTVSKVLQKCQPLMGDDVINTHNILTLFDQ